MSNETGATNSPEQTAPPAVAQDATTNVDATMAENVEPSLHTQPDDAPAGTSGPAPGRQPARKTAWRKKDRDANASNKQLAPKLSKKMKHLKHEFKSHQLQLQWNMQENSKCMLELHKKITRKVDSLSQATEEFYSNKHDLDGEGKATKKYIHS